LPGGGSAHEVPIEHNSDRLRYLNTLARRDAESPHVRRYAERIQRGAGSPLKQIAALHGWVRDRILYTGEQRETFTHPVKVLRYGVGDCDDSARLLVAMLRSLGFRARVELVPPAHVAAQVRYRGRWRWLETTIQAQPFEHPMAAARRLGMVGSSL